MKPVVSRFLSALASKPGEVSMWSDEGSFTVSETDAFARRVAGSLLRDGLRPGDSVTIELPRSRYYVPVALGIWMAGGVPVPSDDAYPEDRKTYIASDSEAKVRVDPAYLSGIVADVPELEFSEPSPDDVAAILYTSGSTGRPKGVVMSSLALSEGIDRICELAGCIEGDRYASPASMTYVTGFVSCVYAMCCGIPLYLVPNDVRVNMVRLAEFTSQHRITHMFMAPAMVPYFRQKEKTMKAVFVGGEKSGRVYSEDFAVVNSYGTTECCCCVSAFKVDRPYDSTPIGGPLGNLRMYVLDAEGKPADEGELCIAGNLASGYRNMPEATAKVFVPNPFAAEDGFAKIYRTGDVVKRLPDGNIVFKERNDWMVNINGQRVEPSEIAITLTSMPQIVQAFVKDFEGSDGQTFLCAYYKLVAPVSEDVIREYLSTKLTRAMIPAYFVRMDVMPLNSSGKVDRSKLPDPRERKEESASAAQRPAGPENAVVRGIREVLQTSSGRGDYGYDDDLVKCGVSSLSCIRFASGIMDRFGVDLEVNAMISGCSIRSIESEIINALMAGRAVSGASSEAARELKESYPLTRSQLGVYLDCYEDRDSVKYNIPFGMDFAVKDGVTVESVCDAIRKVVDAHPALKATVGPDREGIPMIFPHQDAEAVVEVVDASYDEYKAGFVRPFDISGPLYRAVVIPSEDKVRCLFDFHHIIFDGSSVLVFREDLKAALAGAKVEDERYTVFDISEEEAASVDTPAYASARDYYSDLMSGIEGTSLPLRDISSGPRGKGKVAMSADMLDGDLVRKFANSLNITEDAFFQAVMGFTLARYAYSEQSCFTTVHSGRTSGKAAHTVGMLVKTYPVVCRFGSGDTAADYVKSVSSQILESRRNDIYPFTEIATAFDVNTDVMFVFQSIFDASLVSDSIEIADMQNRIVVQVLPVAGGYSLQMDYDTSMYTPAFAEGFARSFVEAARGLLSCSKLGDISLLTSEGEALLDSFGGRTAEYDRTVTVVDLFRRQAAAQPDHDAFVSGGRRWTYGAFDDVTDRLASFIVSRGAKRDTFVAVLTGRNDMGAVASWGAVKSGAGYMPLDPSYPADRLRFMLEDSSAFMMIAERGIVEGVEGLKELVDGFGGTVLYTDEIESLPAGKVPAGPSPRDAILIIYTSGTTGKPKGCVIENAQVTGLLAAELDIKGLSPSSRVAHYASFGFDGGFEDLFIPLAAGAAVYIVDDSIRTDMKAMEDFFNANGITHGFMTTQVGRFFMENARVPSLEFFSVGGEKLVPVKPPEGVRFMDLYGPSETLCYVASHRVLDDGPMQPVGIPNVNMRFYIVDRDMNRLPAGALGELCISGVQVSRGYLNRPDKNEECFVTNPFTGEADFRRMYRTGDVARIRTDGSLDIVGRSDGMVKVRGFRVELTEVEGAIRGFPGITDATVQAFDAKTGGKFLAAYIVSPSRIDVPALNAYIASEKPAYMVPAVTMQIDAIPLTVNSKVDRRRLPAPVMQQEDVTAPTTDLQKRIHAVVAKVVGSEAFGIETDLFAAGLTSIGCIRLNVLMSDEFGVPFQTRDVKENPTVLKLERFIASSQPAKTYGKQDDYPLTKTQEGIFVECLANPGTTVYNIPLVLRMDPGVDIARLKESIVKAVDAHPYIMTSLFRNDDGDVRLKATHPGMFSVDDIEEVTADSLESIRDSLIRPFDLFAPVLFRVKIIHADGEYVLIDMHHIIGDGTSASIFFDTVSRIYDGEEIPEESFSGFEYSLKEQEERAGEGLATSRAYYEELLSGYDRDFLPKGDVYHADPSAPASLRMDGAVGLASKAAAYCDGSKVGMNALMCAAFGYTLSGYAGSDHSVFTTVYNGRNDSRVAYSMSMFVKTLPVVCSVADRTVSPAALAAGIGKQLVESMSHDIYSFSEISRDLDVKADVLFVYQGDEFIFDRFCGMPAEPVDLEIEQQKEPILFQVMKVGDTFRYIVDYDPARFTQEFITFLTRSFDNAVSQFTSCATLDDICLSDGSTMDVVRRVNATDVPYDRERTVVDDFAEAARRDPGHTAVVCEGESITYGELDTVSDYIAEYVHSQGLGRDDFVGILVPRCTSMVTAAEGVLKSGAAYQPLDPTYPEERLQFMLEDSRVELLIADRSLLEKVPGFKGKVLCLDEIPGICTGDRPDVSAYRPSQSDAMIILYTSGTTGTPKGCVLEHGNLYAYLSWMRPETGLDAESVYASYASYGFDACMMDIHASMTSGAEMHIIPDSMRKDIADIDRYFVMHGVTHGFMTTQMGRMFMESTTDRSLKAFMAGGEALVPLKPPSWVDFYNIYGPTECTVNVTTFIVRDDCPLLPIGRPNSNIRLYVLDKNDRIVPVGSCGELCVSGPQVFREYLNNPDKTAMVVVNNPYADCPEHSRLYRTGDVVRLLPDGNIDYIGRRDGMVKVRGFRIELGEVEKAVRDHPAVDNATITAVDNPAGGKSLVAYYVSEKGVGVQELKDFIRKSKPPYMVPSYFVRLDSIPVNVNGKVDRRKLPAPSMDADRKGSEPANEVEAGLCTIFAGVLGMNKVYADDDFFEIGGTSISASKLVMNLMNAGYPVVFKNIFDNPSPRALAAFIATVKDNASVTEERVKTDSGPLARNVPQELPKMVPVPVGRVLLTGATGFLGAHILRELLDSGTEGVVCLVRSAKGQTPMQRIRTVFNYYFEGLVSDDILSRVETVDSDITDPALASRLEGVEFDTIINSAAVVKHFAADDSIEKVNVGGVKNLLSLAEARGARFVQISTESVAGESVNGSIPGDVEMKEDMLDFGQNLDNKYAHSKFMAECAVVDAVSRGLRAKIIRVGNLMSRDSDGEFQINFTTNAFMSQIKAYTKIGCFPVSDLDAPVEFSPIDKVAKAVVLLAGTPDEFTVFHVDNCHRVHMANVLKVLNDNGLRVDTVSDEEFKARFMEILADDTRNQYVSGLISYMGNAGETRRLIAADSTFTVKALYRLGFSWPVISEAYIGNAIRSLKQLRFFR